MRAPAAAFALATTVTLAVVHARADGPSAKDVMTRSADASSLAHVTLTSTLTIGAEDASTRSKSFTLWRKLGGDGRHHRTLTRFSAPAEIRGEAVLFDERAGGRNDVHLYLPRYKKTRRVEAQAQKASFMGSSFSYADMTAHAVDDYTHDIARTEPCPGDPKATCFVVRSTPASAAVRANHGYSRKTSWIRSGDWQTVLTELHDESGAPWKRIAFSDIREVDPARHKAIPFAIRVDDLKAKRFSTIVVHAADARTDVSDALFSLQSMSREL